jgi:hypothetical protein
VSSTAVNTDQINGPNAHNVQDLQCAAKSPAPDGRQLGNLLAWQGKPEIVLRVAVCDNITSNRASNARIVFTHATQGLKKCLAWLINVAPLGNAIVGETILAIWNVGNNIVYSNPKRASGFEIKS